MGVAATFKEISIICAVFESFNVRRKVKVIPILFHGLIQN